MASLAQVVGPAAAPPAGEDAEGEPDDEGQAEGVEGEEAGDGELAGDLGADGLAVDEGVAAEGAVEHGGEPAGVLDGERVVEAELGAEGLADLGGVGGLAAAGEDGGGDVAGEGAHDEEDDEGGEEDRRQEEGEASGEVGGRHGGGQRSTRRGSPPTVFADVIDDKLRSCPQIPSPSRLLSSRGPIGTRGPEQNALQFQMQVLLKRQPFIVGATHQFIFDELRQVVDGDAFAHNGIMPARGVSRHTKGFPPRPGRASRDSPLRESWLGIMSVV